MRGRRQLCTCSATLRCVGPPSLSEGTDDVVLEHQCAPYVIPGIETHTYLSGGYSVMAVLCAVPFFFVDLFRHRQ